MFINHNTLFQVTKLVREASVEALTLKHDGGCYEIACNLLNPSVVTPDTVLEKVNHIIQDLGLDIKIEMYYTTGPSEMDLLTLLNNKLSDVL